MSEENNGPDVDSAQDDSMFNQQSLLYSQDMEDKNSLRLYIAELTRKMNNGNDDSQTGKDLNMGSDQENSSPGNGAGGSQRGGQGKEEPKYTEITKEKPIRLQVKVLIPVKEHPKFNFVGKLLGPKGNSLKRLQEETLTKMAILGRGSMRDKNKEEELRKQNDPKHAHLNEELHIEVNTFAPPADAYSRIGHALGELKKFLVPDDNDEIRQTQLQELAYINGTPIPSGGAPLGRGRGRGAAPPPPIGGPPTARTLRAGLLATPGPRAITSRPGGTPVPASRSPLTAPPRVGGARVPPPPLPRVATYRSALPEAHLRTADEGFTYDEEYEYPETFDQSEAQFYDYAHGAAVDPYDGEYATGEAYTAEEWRPGNETRLKARTNSTRGAYREHPYPPPQVPRY